MKWLLVVGIALSVSAAEATSFTNTEQKTQAIKELDQTPEVVEYNAKMNQFVKIESEDRKKQEVLRKELQNLREAEPYQDYLRKRRALYEEREREWEKERQALIDAAEALYASRHAELKGLARTALPGAEKLGLGVLNYPRMDGSTSTHPLCVILACRILKVPYVWLYPEPNGRPWEPPPEIQPYILRAGHENRKSPAMEFMLATLRVAAKPAEKAQERIAIMINDILAANSSTHEAYVNLINGNCDLNLTARAPSKSELELASEKGIKIKVEPIARDALVFLVSNRNTATNLTQQQVRDIYLYKIENWEQVGQEKKDIWAFWRERDSGSRELFDALVMKDEAYVEKGMPLYSYGMSGPYSMLTQGAYGLGYSIYYYEHFMAASPYTRTLSIDGVEPSSENIASGRYPWVTPVYVAYRENQAPDSPAMKFVRWLLSDEGQSVVRESGYVPVRKEQPE